MNPTYTIQGPLLEYPKSTLHELLEQKALAQPEAIALVFENEKVSYGELQEKINKTANFLYDKGVRPNQIIALSLDRSPDLMIAIFAVLQCGAAYVPIDTGYPTKRMQVIVEDSEASFLFCKSAENGLSDVSKNIYLDDVLLEMDKFPSNSLPYKVNPESVAYIIYTSGSTGTPKGVQVSHLNTINLVYSMGKEPGINKDDKIFAVTTISFDAMVMEIFLPLLHGAGIVIVDEETRLDGQILLEKAIKENVTMMWGTPSIWQILMDSDWKQPLNIKALIGGEPVPLNLAHRLLDLCSELWNIYGPTETTVCAFLTKITKDDDPIAIGKPVANVHAYLLDEKGNPVAPGEVGEIVIGGAGVSLGYLNRPDLNSERFVDDPFATETGKMYLSGDLGKLLPNGLLQCLGRKDHQVKVRGHRIELGEIETVLDKFSSIKKNAVIVSNEIGGEARLVAYLQSANSDRNTNAIRTQLEDILPEFMVPSLFMWIDEFPITPNGKIDKKALPRPEYIRPASAPLLRKPRTELEKNIAVLWSELLQIPNIGIDDNFFDMGGTSLLTQKIVTLMKTRLELKVPVTKIYQYPTIAGLSKYIQGKDRSETKIDYSPTNKKNQSKDVAVIGMAIRFPGASTIEELWDVLKNGKETISFFTPEELDQAIPEKFRKDPLYVPARGIVPSAKEFDASFFGINPKLAEAMDPQQRLFLEIAWETLEQTGYLPKHYNGSVGVYAGTGTNTYFRNNVLPNQELLNIVGVLQAETVNEKDYISSRTAYHLNLKGPAVSVYSACSTSLLAIAEAVDAIRNNRCDVALAGGASVTSPINSGHLYQEGSMLSSDGHCRSFDADGDGTVFSDGAGVILLKSLEAAERDGDVIYGILKGIGLSNDGGNKGSFTAPNAEGQADAISRALLDADVNPADIGYIETHGTATPVGDPIEIEGLQMAFGNEVSTGYCAIGSIKSNMGHLTGAAGVAGVIKTILSLKNQQIPPSLGFKRSNPRIDFENSPFYVNHTLSDWNTENKKLAGISSFGVGGTNVHIIAEEYKSKSQISGESKPLQLLTWSAKSSQSLKDYQTALGNFIKSSPDTNLADIAASLAITRDTFGKRSFLLAKDAESASKLLLSEDISIKSSELKVVSNDLAFLFPGQGAQYLQMGKMLYNLEPVFSKAVEECSEILLQAYGYDIRTIIYPDTNSSEAEERLKDTQFTQPALFVVEYALSQLWMSWGIKPTLLCGHSIGEFVAAHLSGVFTLKDALLLVAVRGKLVSNLPGGSMLSVRTSYNNVCEILPGALSIAAVNSDQLCVVSGEITDIEEFAKILDKKEIPNRLLLTSHAFHSTMMDPVLEEFESEVRKVTLSIPRIPIISTVTGTWLTDSEATDPGYWTNHLRATVRFSEAMETALELEDIVLLEVGPGRALSTLSQQKKNSRPSSAIPSLVIPNENENAYHSVLSALGQLWLKGIEPNWKAFYENETRKKVWLPSYAFDRKYCWAEPPVQKIIKPTHNHDYNTISIESNNTQPIQSQMNTTSQPNRKTVILEKISEIIMNTSGMELESSEYNNSFLELGLDSLVLTQMAITCKNAFDTPISFRQLNGEFSTPTLLADHLDKHLPADRFAPAPMAVPSVHTPIQNTVNNVSTPMQVTSGTTFNDTNSAMSLIAQQLQLLGKQMELLQGNHVGHTPAHTSVPPQPVTNDVTPTTSPSTEILSADEIKEHKKPFGASPKIEKQTTAIDSKQQAFLKALTEAYNNKTAGSKSYTQKHRSHMSDPRVVSGFKPLTKELVYPLVIGKSAGNRLWDVDGNEYLDALNGFGSCLFGHQPEFIKEALHDQIEKGFEVGPQHPLAGEVCELLCELTQHDRSALCNTGSEAVLGAMRIARTVTGRSLIVAFSRSYHGIIDEVLVRGSRMKKTFPAAPGIMPGSVQNMLILDYGTEESLQIIRERANELAAVLVEPLQSRRPEFQPIDFLNEVRDITKNSNTALIFDEIITGFRMHPQGMQGIYKIKADIATYGKVIGGGLSIGAIAGSSKYMDALDGGHWQFGDDSFPEVGVTYFAGTFVRHPLALASAKASLQYLKENGPELQENLSNMTNRLATELNQYFEDNRLPLKINHFKSLWRLSFLEEIPYSELVFVQMRLKGIHIWDGFPCFLTEAYNENDVSYIIKSMLESIDELMEMGIFHSEPNELHTLDNKSLSFNGKSSVQLNQPPVPGAQLGMDESGNPAWYVLNKENQDTYRKIEL
ncbi:MAG TPA: amino acid adenylation domain-containing protein [Aquaticitalea sp.]|nr:amino acid adenylation domain-containing protein [Aquaticitalea sp.]